MSDTQLYALTADDVALIDVLLDAQAEFMRELGYSASERRDALVDRLHPRRPDSVGTVPVAIEYLPGQLQWFKAHTEYHNVGGALIAAVDEQHALAVIREAEPEIHWTEVDQDFEFDTNPPGPPTVAGVYAHWMDM